MLRDPEAFTTWLQADDTHRSVAGRHLDPAVAESLKIPGAIDKLLVSARAPLTYELREALAISFAQNPDPADIAAAKSDLLPRQWEEFSRSLGRNWPADQRDGLLALARAQSEPQLVVGAAL